MTRPSPATTTTTKNCEVDWLYVACSCGLVHVRAARVGVGRRGRPEEFDVRYLHAADRDEGRRLAARAVIEFGFTEARVLDGRADEVVRVYLVPNPVLDGVVEQRLVRYTRRGKVRWSDLRTVLR
jgi:hypothetical protein